ncbi:hypothetical protein VNI00_008978 [Paramarasmius palmivorus]|uniref:Uncharacterized protein n=1 Tax=Paramarasmius palmivorus TaxID=297713 RepID=A0AAW0CRB7_9AGAR
MSDEIAQDEEDAEDYDLEAIEHRTRIRDDDEATLVGTHRGPAVTEDSVVFEIGDDDDEQTPRRVPKLSGEQVRDGEDERKGLMTSPATLTVPHRIPHLQPPKPLKNRSDMKFTSVFASIGKKLLKKAGRVKPESVINEQEQDATFGPVDVVDSGSPIIPELSFGEHIGIDVDAWMPGAFDASVTETKESYPTIPSLTTDSETVSPSSQPSVVGTIDTAASSFSRSEPISFGCANSDALDLQSPRCVEDRYVSLMSLVECYEDCEVVAVSSDAEKATENKCRSVQEVLDSPHLDDLDDYRNVKIPESSAIYSVPYTQTVSRVAASQVCYTNTILLMARQSQFYQTNFVLNGTRSPMLMPESVHEDRFAQAYPKSVSPNHYYPQHRPLDISLPEPFCLVHKDPFAQAHPTQYLRTNTIPNRDLSILVHLNHSASTVSSTLAQSRSRQTIIALVTNFNKSVYPYNLAQVSAAALISDAGTKVGSRRLFCSSPPTSVSLNHSHARQRPLEISFHVPFRLESRFRQTIIALSGTQFDFSKSVCPYDLAQTLSLAPT